MATRTISTKLAIQGESEYRASLSRINSEIKTLRSALKLTESEYRGNANSLAALTSKGKALNDLYTAQKEKVEALRAALENAKKAEQQYAAQKATLEARIKANNASLEELRNTTGDTTEEQSKLVAENKSLEEQLARCNANLGAAEKGVNSWQTQLNNAETSLNALDDGIKQNNRYLGEAEKSADKTADSIDRFGNEVGDANNGLEALANTLAASGVTMGLKKIAETLQVCIDAASEFESAMAGVAKTTDLTDDELAAMGQSIQELSTRIPATTTEIAGVAEAAGQLGIAKEDLLSFTETMVNLGVATNLTSEEAAFALAKFANVVGMSAENYDRLGSTIVNLGNNFATTEADIVSMATRLSSTGAIVGLTEPQIMAIATALSSVGIEAEAGGSAISKLLKQFETMVATGSNELEGFASVAGMSAEEFSQAWGEDAVGALSAFISGLGDVDAQGGSAVAVLGDLGVTEVRLSNAVLSLASSHGILDKALETANSAWAENTALTKEAETRYGTTESKFQMFTNAVNNMKIAVGDLLTPALGKLAEAGTDTVSWAADFIEENKLLSYALAAVTAGAAAFTVAATGMAIAASAVGKAIAAATAAAAASPFTWVAAGIAVVGTALLGIISNLKEATPEIKSMNNAVEEMKNTFDSAEEEFANTQTSIEGTAAQAQTYIDRLKELESQSSMTADEQEEYTRLVDLLKTILPDVNAEIDKQTGLLKDGAESLEDQLTAWKKLAVQEALQAKYTKEMEAYAEAEAKVYDGKVQLTALTEEQTALEEQQKTLYEELSAAVDDYNERLADNSLTMSERAELEVQGQNRIDELNSAYEEVNAKLGENQDKQEALSKTISEAEETAASYNGILEDAQSALAQYNEELESGAEQQGEFTVSQQMMSDAADSVSDRLQQLAKDYKEAYDSAASSLNGQFSLWEQVDGVTALSLDNMQAGIESQISYFEEYETNLQSLLDRNIAGVDQFAANFADGSAESAAALAALAGASDEEIENLITSMSGLTAIKDGLTETFASLQVDLTGNLTSIKDEYAAALEEMGAQSGEIDFSGFTQAVDAAFSDVGATFSGVGSEVGNGLQQGIDDSVAGAQSSANSMGEAVIKSMKTVLGINSPSRVTKEMGVNLDQGLIQGIESKRSAVQNAVSELGKMLSMELGKQIEESTKSISTQFEALPAKTKAQLASLKSTITGEMASMPGQMQSIGAQMVNGMIAGINSRSSALYYAITRITNSAIASARRAAQVRSPSRKTTEIFEQVGEGMIVGLEHKREKVAATAQSVVDQALKLEVSGNVETAISGINDRMPTVITRQTDSGEKIAQTTEKLESAIEALTEKVNRLADDDRAVVLDDGTIVGRWIKRIDRGLNDQKIIQERGGV